MPQELQPFRLIRFLPYTGETWHFNLREQPCAVEFGIYHHVKGNKGSSPVMRGLYATGYLVSDVIGLVATGRSTMFKRTETRRHAPGTRLGNGGVLGP